MTLLDWAVGLEHVFQPAKVARYTGKGAPLVAPHLRSSRLLPRHALAPWRAVLTDLFMAAIPDALQHLRMPRPEQIELELELAAHGDGDFYRCHRDHAASGRARSRIVSLVYYFNAEPAKFSGGALRLHAPCQDATKAVDIAPRHNRLVAFPSWAPHQVMPIACPSGRFDASRFAINCWVHDTVRKAPPNELQS